MKSLTKSKLISVIFLAFVFVMGILYAVLPKSDFSQTEKRYLAEFPEFSLQSLSSGKFTSEFEQYLTDHTPFRNFFVSVNSYYELAKGNNGSNGVYLGSDGWLIEKPFDRENRFDSNMQRIVSFAKKQDIPVALTAVPEKGEIYSDKLPANSLDYPDAEYMDRISQKCADDVTFINLLDSMKSQKDKKQLFYKTDHHWTTDGAYLGYTEICRALNLEAAPESSFNTEERYEENRGFYGTSYATSLFTLTEPESMKIMRSKKTDGAADIVIEDGGEKKYSNMFFEEAFDGIDWYTVFLDGNHPFVRIKTGNEGGKLLVIKDSFAHCLVPFLAENYSEIVMIDLRYYKMPVSALIEKENFSRILFAYGMENLAESKDIILR